MLEKHSKVPHILKVPATKDVMTSTGSDSVDMVMKLHTTSTGQMTMSMDLAVNLNFRRKSTGKIMVMPTKEA